MRRITIAVLPPTCGDFVNRGVPCAYRNVWVPDSVRTCPDGTPTAFNAATIEAYHATAVRPLTAAEREALDRAIDEQARSLAAKWTDNGRVPLGPAAPQELQNVSCSLVAFGNPDVRCVRR